MVLPAFCDLTPAFLLSPFSHHSSPWTLGTSTPLDPCSHCTLLLKCPSHPVCLAKRCSSSRFQCEHHLLKDAFPALQPDPGPLVSDSPRPWASLWHGPIRSCCYGLSTSLPLLLPPSQVSCLWADRGRISSILDKDHTMV